MKTDPLHQLQKQSFPNLTASLYK